MLSAIVQKTYSARPCDYLTPRLFEPLESGADLEKCPRGSTPAAGA